MTLAPATRGVFLAALASTGFGMLGFFGKRLFDQGVEVGHALMMRFWIASALLWLYLGLRRRQEIAATKPKTILVCLALGVLGYAGQASLFFTALHELKSGLASVLLYLYPAIAALIVTALTRKAPSRIQVFAMVMTFLGCFLVVDLADASLTRLGLAAGIGSAAWYAAYLIASETVLRGVKPVVASGFIFTGAAVAFTLYAFSFETTPWPPSAAAWLYAGAMAVISTALPVIMLFMSIQYIGTVRSSIICTVEPVVTILAGFLLLGERLTVTQLVGIGIILGTLIWMRLRDMRQMRLSLQS